MSDHEDLARGLVALANQLPDTKAGIVAKAILHFAAKIAMMGKDPVAHLSRLPDLDPAFDAASKAADAAAFGKFHGDPEPPPEEK